MGHNNWLVRRNSQFPKLTLVGCEETLPVHKPRKWDIGLKVVSDSVTEYPLPLFSGLTFVMSWHDSRMKDISITQSLPP